MLVFYVNIAKSFSVTHSNVFSMPCCKFTLCFQTKLLILETFNNFLGATSGLEASKIKFPS